MESLIKNIPLFGKRINEYLAREWGKPYSKVKEWVCVQSQLSIIIRAVFARNVNEASLLKMELHYHAIKFKTILKNVTCL